MFWSFMYFDLEKTTDKTTKELPVCILNNSSLRYVLTLLYKISGNSWIVIKLNILEIFIT